MVAAADDNQDDSQKTEDPTPKRLKEMRDKGQVAMSREINNWAMLFASTLIVLWVGPWLLRNLTGILKPFIELPHMLLTDPYGIQHVMIEALKEVALYMAVPALVLVIVAIIAPLVQVGPIWSLEPIKPSLDKISLIKGLGRLFSLKSIIEFLKGIAKLVIVGAVISAILWPFMGEVNQHVGETTVATLIVVKDLTIKIMAAVLAILFVVAVLDFMYQRFEFMKKAKMSRQEIKEEFKQTEGDPHVKGRLRQLRQERARRRMMADVPKADVVITNPTHFAVALQYDPQKMNAPVMIAKGVDAVALKIREVAKENKIPLMENPPLARALYASMDLDDEIPAEHYKAVANIITYVFKLKGKKLS